MLLIDPLKKFVELMDSNYIATYLITLSSYKGEKCEKERKIRNGPDDRRAHTEEKVAFGYIAVPSARLDHLLYGLVKPLKPTITIGDSGSINAGYKFTNQCVCIPTSLHCVSLSKRLFKENSPPEKNVAANLWVGPFDS